MKTCIIGPSLGRPGWDVLDGDTGALIGYWAADFLELAGRCMESLGYAVRYGA